MERLCFSDPFCLSFIVELCAELMMRLCCSDAIILGNTVHLRIKVMHFDVMYAPVHIIALY